MAGAAALPSRSVSWAPLALTLGLHLLLVLAWWWRPGLPLPATAPGARATVLVMVKPPPRPAPAAVSGPVLQPRPATRARSPAVTAPVQPAPADAVPEPEATPAPAEAGPAPAPLPGELLAASRRMAGRIDRALRKGASPVTAEPERKWERFAGMVAAARTNPGNGVSLDSYTGLDGVTIYRKTVGERVSCYRSGSVGGIGPADGRSAGNVSCPTDVRWTRH